jgi:hypothetical protein
MACTGRYRRILGAPKLIIVGGSAKIYKVQCATVDGTALKSLSFNVDIVNRGDGHPASISTERSSTLIEFMSTSIVEPDFLREFTPLLWCGMHLKFYWVSPNLIRVWHWYGSIPCYSPSSLLVTSQTLFRIV